MKPIESMSRISAEAIIRKIFETTCGADRLPPHVSDLPKPKSAEAEASNGMERFWITQLHRAFREQYPDDGTAVLFKHQRDEPWRRSEFLHDITVVRRDLVPSPYRAVRIPIIRRVLWQVESELSGDGRQVAVDLSKLIAGSAESKLMVVRLPTGNQMDGFANVKAFLEEAFETCEGHLFVAFLPPYASRHSGLNLWRNPGALGVRLFAREQDGILHPLPMAP